MVFLFSGLIDSKNPLKFKIIRWIEFFLLFAVVPLLYFFDIISIPAIPSLLIFFALCIILLWKDSSFNLNALIVWRDSFRNARKILLRFLVISILMTAGVFVFMPEQFLSLPLNQPLLWGILFLLYPILSAFPQEVIYRLFLFHRYRNLVRNPQILSAMSIIAFAFLHIIYSNWTAVLLSLAGGCLFTKTYTKTGSLLTTTVEHTLYGWLIFTIGLGVYFHN